MGFSNKTSKIFPVLLAATAVAALVSASPNAWSQGHGGMRGGGGGHDSGSTSHGDGHSSDDGHSSGGVGGKKAGSGRGGARGGRGSGHQSLRDIFRGMEDEAAAENAKQSGMQGGGKKTSSASATKGKGGSASKGGKPTSKVAEDSDRPAWAGTQGPGSKPGRPNLTPGIKKGSIYGDMYIVVRDVNGVPILDGDGNVQVLYVDPNTKELTCCIPRDDEGNLLPTLPSGVAVLPVEVELGRLSVGRSPTRVLSAQYDEAIKAINDATSVTLDAAGRFVLTLPDGTTKTIDSPLENLALYVELLNTGTLTDVDPTKLASLPFLTEGTLTAEDLKVAASFFAAASDKTIPVSIDSIVYMNTILKIDGALPDDYVDYTSFTYDRSATYSSVTIEILVQQPDGTWKPTTVNVYDAVFSSTPLTTSNVEGFTAATDDARTVINFIHEYSVPTTN